VGNFTLQKGHTATICGHTTGDASMTAFNVVRFRVKLGREEKFLNAHRNVQADWQGLKKVNDLVAARPKMIATFDSFRDMLEDLGGDLGVTDPVSGPVILELK
jgi:hypothetical protein